MSKQYYYVDESETLHSSPSKNDSRTLCGYELPQYPILWPYIPPRFKTTCQDCKTVVAEADRLNMSLEAYHKQHQRELVLLAQWRTA